MVGIPALFAAFCLLVSLLVAGETFPVCIRCYHCARLPKSLEGRVVDVPSSPPMKTEWLAYDESIVSNQTEVLIFRSVDSNCNVEIKLKSINSTVQFIVYPAGRQDPTIAIAGLGPVDNFCFTSGDQDVSLGTSVVSTGPELAIVFVKLQNDIKVDFHLLYRQHRLDTVRVGGLPLAPPPMDGSTRTLQLANPSVSVGLPGYFPTVVTWSIGSPAATCAMEIKFTGSTSNTLFALNELNPAFIGITHRVPRGQEAIIRVWKSSPFAAVNAIVAFEYRAAECGAPASTIPESTELQIASWNDVVKPLERAPVLPGADPWQTVNFSFPSDGAQQLAVWFLVGTDPAYVTLTSWQDYSSWDSGIPQLYSRDFFRRFNSRITPGTFPYVTTIANFPTKLMYAFLSATAPPILVATANSSEPRELPLTPDMVTMRRIYIKAANESCAVAVWRHDDFNHYVDPFRLLPFGFSSPFNDLLDAYDDQTSPDPYVGSSVIPKPTRSVGAVMGIQFYAWMYPSGSLFYRMVCPILLDSTVHTGEWHSVRGNPGAFLLPHPPPRKGKQCRLDVSSVSSSTTHTLHPQIHLLVSCFETPRRGVVLGGHKSTSSDALCNGTLHVDAYAVVNPDIWPPIHRPAPLFAYRVRCEGDSIGVDDGLAPFAPLQKPFVAGNKWKNLDTQEYEYEGKGYRDVWMVQAKDPNCQVEVYIDDASDMSQFNIVEDFMQDMDNAVLTKATWVEIKHIHYISCDRRVFLIGLEQGISVKSKLKYRQLCGSEKPGFRCAQKLTVVPSLDGTWKTLQGVSNGNLNQLRQLEYHIEFPSLLNGTQASSDRLLELDFTSLVSAESWSGILLPDRGTLATAETHGIRINYNFRAVAGKQFLFKNSANITVDSLIRSKRGDHIFTVRYRLVDKKQGREEMPLGEVLTATNTVKSLNFKVPQQFSDEQLQAIRMQQFMPIEDYFSGESILAPGDFPIWFFHHLYTIRPLDTSCQAAVRFSKIDIGSGYVWGNSNRYSNVQHRLSISAPNNGSQRLSVSCLPDFMDDPILNPGSHICARMDRIYMSAPGSPLIVRFTSDDSAEHGEYEYEYENMIKIPGAYGPEVTFGSGWTATYQQVCGFSKSKKLSPVRPTAVTAKRMGDVHIWQTGLPGQFKSDKYRLFRNKRWLITAQQTTCAVQYVVEAKMPSSGKEPMPVLFKVGAETWFPAANETFTSPNVTVVYLGSSKRNPIVFKYRQVCTQVPTASPTRPPAFVVPAGSRCDGETCASDQQCASMICSKTLLRCTATTCMSKCGSRNSSQSMCSMYTASGCSCVWSETAGACGPVT